MNSHCHVQGRAAQGQLIAFMIMISRQIYRACSDNFSRAAENEFTAAGLLRPLALAQVALFDSLHIIDSR